MDDFEFELTKAARTLIEGQLKVKEEETVVITADTKSNSRVVDAVGSAVSSTGAKPVVIWLKTPSDVGKEADPMLPKDVLTAALKETDVWIEFNSKWLLYSTPYDVAMEENENLRYMCLVGMNPEMMVRCIGQINYPRFKEFMQAMTKMTENAERIRMTTPSGEEVEFNNKIDQEVDCDAGDAETPGPHFLAGQIGWVPDIESVNGTITFDGSVAPPCGKLEEPIHLEVEKGEIIKVSGGKQASEFDRWLKDFDHPQMRKLAHVCFGFNPGCKLTGNILEDERVWGCTEWGIGNMPPDRPAPSHTDGVSLDTSVWMDGEKILDKGEPTNEKLKKAANDLVNI